MEVKGYRNEALMPRLTADRDNLVLAQFDIMKLIPADYIIRRALERGDLAPGGTVVEISSGTFALALAIVTRAEGLNLKVVTIDIDPCLLWRLQSLGAEVHVISEPDASGSIQQTQLRRLEKIMAETPGAFWCAQYRNPDTPASYGILADYLATEIGHIDTIVGTVGTGGSMTGTASALRPRFPDLSVVAVDSNYSVTFMGCDDAATPECKYYMDNMLGLGSRVDIAVIDHTQFDWIHWMPFVEMVAGAHELHRNTGLLSGPTGGAAYKVAQHLAVTNPSQTVVALLPDSALRYVTTVFNPSFVDKLPQAAQSAAPRYISHLSEIGPDWCAFSWAQRSKSSLAAAA